MKVIYKGARDGKNYDNFTYNKIYEAKETKDYLFSGNLIVTNDRNKKVHQPSVDFDFIN